MNKQVTLITKRAAVAVPESRRPRQENARDPRVLTLQAECMRLGFMLDSALTLRLSTIGDTRFNQLYRQVITHLRSITGDDAATWEPFYPNFPRQVVEASDVELFFNAICHYWTAGEWRPQFSKEARLPEFEAVNYKILTLAGEADLMAIFGEILGANASVTPKDRDFMLETMNQVGEDGLVVPDRIPFKENLCWFVAECVERGWEVTGASALMTATDILRVATHMSGGDISLAENTRFRSFRRPVRRALCERLESVGNQDDIFRHRGKWVRLGHSLHIGDYAKSCPKAYSLVQAARSNDTKYTSFEGRVDRALKDRNRKALVDLLKTRPGVFARRLDHVIRTFGATGVVVPFLSVADQVDTRVLMQLYGHFGGRDKDVSRRLVFPKGGQGRSRLLTQTLPAISQETIERLQSGIWDVLYTRFGELDPIKGTVYVDPDMAGCPVPLSLRSASESLVTVGRGTRLPLGGDKGTVRMFIYWKGRDIDLSGFFVNEDFTQQHEIAYYNLRSGFSHHSGDITSAPNGACEFIDVDIQKALDQGYRYLAMSVLVYSGPDFADHEVCYAGWMTRNKVQSNEIFDPKTVEQKVSLTCQSKKAIPVIFDLKERKAIWLDMSTGRGYDNVVAPNNVATNKPSLYDAVTGAINLENKPTLYDLFMMHAEARADFITEDPSEADMIFSWDGDVKPTDTTAILADYLV